MIYTGLERRAHIPYIHYYGPERRKVAFDNQPSESEQQAQGYPSYSDYNGIVGRAISDILTIDSGLSVDLDPSLAVDPIGGFDSFNGGSSGGAGGGDDWS